MRTRVFSIAAMGMASLLTINTLSRAQDNPPPPPPGQDQPDPGAQGGPGGQNGPNGQRMQNPGWHIIPPFMMQRLQLSSEQQEQIKTLDAKVKAELEKILTPEQMKMLNEGRPPRMQGQGGPGGQGGQGGQSGPGNQGVPQRNNRPQQQEPNN